MRVEETPEPAKGHRPLPSVKIPLLREELRATRIKQVAGATALVLTLAGGVSAAILLRSSPPEDGEGDGDEGEPPRGAEAAAVPEPEEPELEPLPATEPDASVADPPMTPGAVDRTVTKFGDGPSFRHALAAAKVEGEGAKELERALDGVLDFRRCRSDHRMVIERDAEGRVVLFEYHSGPTGYIQATRGGNGELQAERVEVPVEKVRLARGGRVRASLGEALEEVGLGRSLVGAFVSVFEGMVNFSSDTREGDVFRILVDEERIDGEFLRYGTAHAVEYIGQRTGTLRAFWYEPRDGRGEFFDETGRAIHGGWLRTPCRYDRISSKFNPRRMHPVLRRIVPHNGVDYAAGSGTPVWAAASGKVTFAAHKGANGNLVSIRHDGGYETLYAHLLRFAEGIRRGVRVEQRQVIGYVGSTGRSTGPHLHFALKKHGRFMDPQEELNGPGRRLPAAELERFRRHKKKLEEALANIRMGPAPVVGPPPEERDPVDEPMD
ncbi:MAG: peptidoglycan DD-metalloendopeptidase family protein [Myxococcota bacterium]